MVEKKILFKKIKKILLNATILFGIFMILNLPMTYSTIFTDIEKATENTLTASILDLVLSSENDDFDPYYDFGPGSTGERHFEVLNDGKTQFVYSLSYKNDSPDTGLCDLLELKVTYQHPNDGDNEIYYGHLKDFDIEFDKEDTDFDHMELDPGETNKYLFDLVYPGDAGELDDTQCPFNIKAVAWQKDYSAEVAFWDEEEISSDVTTEEEDDDENPDKGNHCEGIDVKDIYNGGSLTTYESDPDEVIDGVCIKSGSNMFGGEHGGLFTEDGTYGDGCYLVTGIGTTQVSVEKLLDGKYCQYISHIDVSFTGDDDEDEDEEKHEKKDSNEEENSLDEKFEQQESFEELLIPSTT
jgi:hypothetical protein